MTLLPSYLEQYSSFDRQVTILTPYFTLLFNIYYYTTNYILVRVGCRNDALLLIPI